MIIIIIIMRIIIIITIRHFKASFPGILGQLLKTF